MESTNIKCKFCKVKEVKKSHNIFCSRTCRWSFEKEQYIKEWKAGTRQSLNTDLKVLPAIRTYIKNKYNNQCARCGWHEINPRSGIVPLEIEHIDGDWQNNKEENLIALCPNCHALTESYANSNKGNGRWTYMKNQNKI